MIKLIFWTGILLSFSQLSAADKNYNFSNNIKEKSLLASDDFSNEASIKQKPWSLNHGTWKVLNNTLTGKKIEAENHAPNISLNHKLSQKYLYTLDFKLQEKGLMTFALLGGGGGKGVRIYVSEKDLYIQLKGGSGVIAWKMADISADKWHKLSVMVVEDYIVASVDDKVTIYGKHEKVKVGKSRLSIGNGNKYENNFIDNVKMFDINVDKKSVNKSYISKAWTMKEFHQLRIEKIGLDARGREPK